MKPTSLLATALVLHGAASLASAQDPRAPFEASWVAFPNDTSIVATGDFDADGHVDGIGWYWLNTNYSQAILRTYRNDGSGNFSRFGTQHSASLRRSETWDVRVGRLDLVAGDDWVAAFDDTLLTSTGLRWVEAAPVRQLRLLDFDGDGLDDLATLGADLRLYRNGGASGFALRDTLTLATGNLTELHAAEIDGDGVPDLVCAGPTQVEMVRVVNGALVPGPSYPLATSGAEQVMFATGDIDGDLDTDVVAFIDRAGGIAGRAEYVTLRRTGPATFVAEPRAPGGPATGLHDIDGDGDLDGTCCGGGGPSPARNSGPSTFNLSINDGTGRFQMAWTITGLGAFRFAGAVDVDQDGDRDLIAGRSVFFNQSGFAVDPQPDGMRLPILRRADDMDGDGDPDAAASWSSRYDNDGTGALTQVPVMNEPPPVGQLVGTPIAGDFDADGDVDLIARHSDRGTFLGMLTLWNNGGGGFVVGDYAAGPGVSFSNATTPLDNDARWVVADVDADGDQDVIVGNRFGFIAFRVWANDGRGSFGLHQFEFGGQPHAVVDLDGDGHVDLVTADNLHFGVGDGTFTARGPHGIAVAADGMVGIGDLRGDGRIDVAWSRHHTEHVSVLWNQGGRNFVQGSIPTPYRLSNSSTSDIMRTAILDADGDGHQDIAVGPTLWYEGDNTLILFGDARGGFARHTMMSFELGRTVDVDGDGDLDLLGPEIVRGASAVVPGDGLRRQYGAGTAGLGGMTSTLGATGPFHAGGSIELRMTGAPGSALSLLLLGLQQAELSDWPLPGLRGYLSPPFVAWPLFAGGTPGVAGAGSWRFALPVPAELSGARLFHQVFVADPSATSGVTNTCGLELAYR